MAAGYRHFHCRKDPTLSTDTPWQLHLSPRSPVPTALGDRGWGRLHPYHPMHRNDRRNAQLLETMECLGKLENPGRLSAVNHQPPWRRVDEWQDLRPAQRGGRCNRKRVQLRFEAMESRVLLATTFLVTNTNDDGAGSLRQVILDANPAAQPPHDRFSDRNGRPSDNLSAVSPAGDHQLRDHRRYLPAGLYGLPAD